MTDTPGIADKALEIIAGITGKLPSELQPNLNLMVDLQMDSPKALELLMALEDDLGFEISDDEASELETVGDILDLAVQKAG